MISQLSRRILEALRLNSDTYEDVGNDHSAFYQALFIVVIASVVGVVGPFLSDSNKDPFWALTLAIPLGILSWAIWALCIRMVGNAIFDIADRTTHWGRLFRVTGFAHSPGILAVFIFLPIIGDKINFVVALWTILCMIVAVRPERDLHSTLRTLLVIVLAFVPMYLLTHFTSVLLYHIYTGWL